MYCSHSAQTGLNWKGHSVVYTQRREGSDMQLLQKCSVSKYQTIMYIINEINILYIFISYNYIDFFQTQI